MTLHGIDISHWQTGIDLGATDAQFVIVKVTDGSGGIDPAAAAFAHQVIDAGLLGGAYHYYEGAGTGVARREADHFVDTLQPVIGRALLALDFEHSTTDVAGAHAFLDRVTERTGVRPLIYMSQSLCTAHDWSAVAKDYALWVARYTSADTPGPTGAWDDVTMWQYTDAHHTAGYTVDADRFYGDPDTWRALAAGSNTHHDDTGGFMKYETHDNNQLQTFSADEWHSVHVDEDGTFEILAEHLHFIATVALTFTGEEGAEYRIRVAQYKTVPGSDPDKRTDAYVDEEFISHGGDTQAIYTMQGSLDEDRKLRVEVWGGKKGGKYTVSHVRTKVTGW
jgi:GH25 family lysozyme M1 (1,4-beta-N-acetylmuramidase)